MSLTSPRPEKSSKSNSPGESNLSPRRLQNRKKNPSSLVPILIGREFRPSLNSIVVPENSTTEQNVRAAEDAPERTSAATESLSSRLKVLGWSGIVFAILQSACTAVIAISGVRVALGLGALAAAAGIHAPAKSFHQDAIRIPMMLFSLFGSLINFFLILKVPNLRSKPPAQWRQ